MFIPPLRVFCSLSAERLVATSLDRLISETNVGTLFPRFSGDFPKIIVMNSEANDVPASQDGRNAFRLSRCEI
jgi:hypothetical protein